MYVSTLLIKDIMSFSGPRHFSFRFSPYANYLVGNNNCGKSTVLTALEILSSKKCKTPELKPIDSSTSEGYVQATICDNDVSRYPSKIRDAIIRFKSTYRVIIRRTVSYSGNGEKINDATIFDPSKRSFSIKVNDTVLTEILSPTVFDALANPNDYSDFGTTKTLGKLLDTKTKLIEASSEWTNFKKSFGQLANGPHGINVAISDVVDDINDSLNDLFGGCSVDFSFSTPDIRNVLKSGSILVNDGFQITDIHGKGSGLQKAFAFSVIRAFAKRVTNLGASKLDLCIDEPETWLHPQAQIKFAETLFCISNQQQLWIATHSPYMLYSFSHARGDSLIIFSAQTSTKRYRYCKDLIPLNGSRPSLGQISYKAFGINTVEYHSELLGYIQYHSGSSRLIDLDTFFSNQKDKCGNPLFQTKMRCKLDRNNQAQIVSETLAVYIRNCIDHPEAKNAITAAMQAQNITNEYTNDEMGESIAAMELLIDLNKATWSVP